jgi:hypothetical protein
MIIETRRNKADKWKTAAQSLISYYFDTTDVEVIKALFGSKRIFKKMNLEFRIVK